jgi:hypothetical protein
MLHMTPAAPSEVWFCVDAKALAGWTRWRYKFRRVSLTPGIESSERREAEDEMGKYTQGQYYDENFEHLPRWSH